MLYSPLPRSGVHLLLYHGNRVICALRHRSEQAIIIKLFFPDNRRTDERREDLHTKIEAFQNMLSVFSGTPVVQKENKLHRW